MIEDIYSFKEAEYGISPLPKNPVVAMAYVPYQNNDELYSSEQGIVTGTMFPVLNKPFVGCRRDKS